MADDKNSGDRTDPEVERLCELLLGMDRATLRAALQRTEDPAKFTRHVSNILGDAMRISAHQDPKLGEALAPAISEGVHTTVKRDPGTFGEALAPAMGPAIRQAVLQTFRNLVETFEKTMEQSFSPRGWRWRIEAWRTGKPLTEVIFMHTLAFRVEHVFLIHRETSLLLQQASRGVASREPDLISAMLTAIQDFVSDAFESPTGDRLDSFRVGDLTVWIEDSPHAVFAGVIRGQPLNRIRLHFRAALENVNVQFADELRAFEGDATPLAATLPELEFCLLEKLIDEEDNKKSGPSAATKPILIAVAAAALISFIWWKVVQNRETERWNNLVAELEDKPGIVITAAEVTDTGYRITGLKDPMAGTLSTLIPAPSIELATIAFDWTPIHSLEPEIVQRRCVEALAPPDPIKLTVDEKGTLCVKQLAEAGAAGVIWRQQIESWAKPPATTLRALGVTRVDFSLAKDAPKK